MTCHSQFTTDGFVNCSKPTNVFFRQMDILKDTAVPSILSSEVTGEYIYFYSYKWVFRLIHLIKYRSLKKEESNCTSCFLIWRTFIDQFLILVKSHVTDQRVHDGMSVPAVSERPVKDLGRWYDGKLKETKVVPSCT